MYWATILGAVAGVLGTGIGGLMAYAIPRLSRRSIHIFSGFPAGLMLAVTAFDLLPEAMEAGGVLLASAGFLAGAALIIVIGRAMGGGRNKTWLLALIGIALHNLPEGLAIGAGMAAEVSLGLSLCLVIALHDMPEGLAIGLPMRGSGGGIWRSAGFAALSGLPTAIGAAMGYALGVTPAALSLCLGGAGGAMICVACGDMLPGAVEEGGSLAVVALCLGFTAGLAICAVLGG